MSTTIYLTRAVAISAFSYLSSLLQLRTHIFSHTCTKVIQLNDSAGICIEMVWLHTKLTFQRFDSTLQAVNMQDWNDHAHSGFLPVGKRSPGRLGIPTWNPMKKEIQGWVYFVMALEELYAMQSFR